MALYPDALLQIRALQVPYVLEKHTQKCNGDITNAEILQGYMGCGACGHIKNVR